MKSIKEELKVLKVNNLSVSSIAYLALFIAAVALATFIKVPGLNTSYYNLGEVFIYTIALVFGRKAGAIAGAFGAALMDLLLFPIWAPFTFLIKGFEGWVVGMLAEGNKMSQKIFALIVGGHVMIIGYALVVWLLYGWPAVLPEIGGNYGQAAVGAIIAIPLARQIDKVIS